MDNLCGEVQGSTSQRNSLNGNRNSAALLEVRGSLSNMEYSSVALDPDTPVNNGSGVPRNSEEGTKAAALTASEVRRACAPKCFQSRYLTKTSTQGHVYNFLERPSGWKCFIYHFTVEPGWAALELRSRTIGYTEAGGTGTEENLGPRDRRLDWIVIEIETGASDAETGEKVIQEQASSRAKRSSLKQEGQRNKGWQLLEKRRLDRHKELELRDS
ncbi:potassium voltage-gated channel subfamily kqt member 1-like isoform x3 [Limosa lapponica baueri]|uniref:Potassium voltage-gated channel subfamily kqt member 1-like isoform x3 n=1 Tax=Limosa lapponica baueri TaxID=1758121 RepID=A0A2I0T655_LIMLA|nr:potassium voltage-gated channel subfamily kqt member 1-like isoform x3 [Limosa lapponica baueri]